MLIYRHTTRGNRFGDDDLDTPFVWKAKEGDQSTSVSEKQLVLKRVANVEKIIYIS